MCISIWTTESRSSWIVTHLTLHVPAGMQKLTGLIWVRLTTLLNSCPEFGERPFRFLRRTGFVRDNDANQLLQWPSVRMCLPGYLGHDYVGLQQPCFCLNLSRFSRASTTKKLNRLTNTIRTRGTYRTNRRPAAKGHDAVMAFAPREAAKSLSVLWRRSWNWRC